MINFYFRKGGLHSDYYATENGEIDASIQDEIALFISFTSPQDMETCNIFRFRDNTIVTVVCHDLTLLSKNEK